MGRGREGGKGGGRRGNKRKEGRGLYEIQMAGEGEGMEWEGKNVRKSKAKHVSVKQCQGIFTEVLSFAIRLSRSTLS